MKKYLYFIALIGAVLMFFIFPDISSAYAPPDERFCSVANDIFLTCDIPTTDVAPVSNGEYPTFKSFLAGARHQTLGSFAGGATVNLSTSDMVNNMANGDTASIFGYSNYASSGSITSYDCSNPDACSIVGNGSSRFLDFPVGSFFSSQYNWQGYIVSVEDDSHLTLWRTSAGYDIGSIYIYPIASYSTFSKIDNTHWIAGSLPTLSGLEITSPTTGSTITDTSTELVGAWGQIDSTIWNNLKIAFIDFQIGETSKIVNVPLTTDDGDFSIPLSAFEITKNGDWTLRAIVENEYEYNFDILSPIYMLTFNVEGLPTPYAFTDFDDWYSTNVPNYETPSAWAVAMVGFLQPIFEKIGEYGNRIETYLDISDAYEKGFQIGGIFPVVIAYVKKIDLFFGGFPIVQFFKWLIIAMIGIFAVKAILKLLSFIPFIGGSG